jgi:hypothetical protein
LRRAGDVGVPPLGRRGTLVRVEHDHLGMIGERVQGGVHLEMSERRAEGDLILG